jgi:hypothetical protein
MTTENMQPQGELGSSNGQGQSQGHRRRRRRRKNKATSGAAAQTPVQQMQAPPAQAQPQSQPPAQSGSNQGSGQNNNQNRRKKKKKFTPKGPAQQQTHQPGNTTAPQHHGKKKRQQKGPREFVGPMDHSYRVVNGNVADSPASTIHTYGSMNGNGNFYNENYVPSSTAAATAANGPARIFFFIEDLFFNAKINENCRKLGVKVEFLKGDKESIARLTDTPEAEWPKLIVFDLNNAAAKPLTLIPKLKNKFKKSTSIIGFLSHLQGDLKMKGIEAGCDTVMPRSAFSQSLPNLLRRYGMEDDDDNYPQPM